MGFGDIDALTLAANETFDALVLGDADWSQIPADLKTVTHAYEAGNKAKEQAVAGFNKFYEVVKQNDFPAMEAVEDAIVAAKDAAERAEMLKNDSVNLASLAEQVHNGALDFVQKLEAIRKQVEAVQS